VKPVLWTLLVLYWGSNVIASPISALSSPFQQTRDVAAAILRKAYLKPSRTNWDSLLASIKVGDRQADVNKRLERRHFKSEGAGGSGSWDGQLFRLDDLWVLELSSQNGLVVDRNLREQMRAIWVSPSAAFSGIWITYFVNGQKSNEIHYKDGSYSGEFVAFYPDGSKCYVQHYNHQMAHGTDTGFFPSGRINYRGEYKTNAQIGIWVWYNEDGSTNSVKKYPSVAFDR
jgi:hypothetical protein